MSEDYTPGMPDPQYKPINNNKLSEHIDALPAPAGLWRLIALLSLGGFFELYNLFQTAYISSGLIAGGIFHVGDLGVFGISDQTAFASMTFIRLFLVPVCWLLTPIALAAA